MRRALLFVLVLAVVASPAAAVPVQQAVAEADSAPYLFLLARHLEDNGKIEEAIAALKKALELEPKSAQLRAELAGIYARQDRALEALNMAEEALKVNPDNRDANRLLGSIYSALSEQKRPLRPGDDPSKYAGLAIAALEKTQQSSRMDLGVDFTLGRLYLRTGTPDKAILALQRVFDQQPEYSEGGMLLATAQEDTGKIDDAIATLEGTIKHNPSYFRAYLRLIELYEGQRRWKEAAGAYALAQAINPRADLAGGRAAALLNSGAPAEARTLLEETIAARKTPDASLLYLLAESQRQLKDYVGATATAARLRSAFPDDARGLVIEAQLHVAQGRREEALKTFAELVVKVPGEATFQYQYAQLLEESGRIADAERVLRALVERDPMDANALNALGYMFADRGERLTEAVELLQRALKIEPGNPSFLDSLGWAFFKQGQLAQAETPLAEAAAKLPGNSVIQDHLGDLRFRQQRYAEAVVAWERALAGDGQTIDRQAVEKKLRDARARVPKK